MLLDWKEFTVFSPQDNQYRWPCLQYEPYPPELSSVLIIVNQGCHVCGNIMLKSYSNEEKSANQPKLLSQ